MSQHTTVTVIVTTTTEHPPPTNHSGNARCITRNDEEVKFVVRNDDRDTAIKRTLTRLQSFVEE